MVSAGKSNRPSCSSANWQKVEKNQGSKSCVCFYSVPLQEGILTKSLMILYVNGPAVLQRKTDNKKTKANTTMNRLTWKNKYGRSLLLLSNEATELQYFSLSTTLLPVAEPLSQCPTTPSSPPATDSKPLRVWLTPTSVTAVRKQRAGAQRKLNVNVISSQIWCCVSSRPPLNTSADHYRATFIAFPALQRPIQMQGHG